MFYCDFRSLIWTPLGLAPPVSWGPSPAFPATPSTPGSSHTGPGLSGPQQGKEDPAWGHRPESRGLRVGRSHARVDPSPRCPCPPRTSRDPGASCLGFPRVQWGQQRGTAGCRGEDRTLPGRPRESQAGGHCRCCQEGARPLRLKGGRGRRRLQVGGAKYTASRPQKAKSTGSGAFCREAGEVRRRRPAGLVG